MKIVVKKTGPFDVMEVQGRIDGLSSAEFKLALEECAKAGVRQLIINCSMVTYISSAGLRVFIQTRKSMGLIGGTMLLMTVPEMVRDVFRISGMENFMTFIEDLPELDFDSKETEPSPIAEGPELNGVRFEMRVVKGSAGRVSSLGSSLQLKNAGYTAGDVIALPQHEITFGLGLAVLGNDFDDFKNFFGEAIVVKQRFFSYPAVKKSYIDFSGFVAENPTRLNFLTGFRFTGDYSRVLKMPVQQASPNIETLLGAVETVAAGNLFGVVILAVSGGIYGMHLQKSPIAENNPAQIQILDDHHFAEWMNFPVEGEDIHKIIIATGVIVRDPLLLPAHLKPLFPANSRFHMHAVVFDSGLLNLNVLKFESELQRVMDEFEPQKVVHLLPSSQLQSGFIGIINLEEN